jgi:hypothetical protein
MALLTNNHPSIAYSGEDLTLSFVAEPTDGTGSALLYSNRQGGSSFIATVTVNAPGVFSFPAVRLIQAGHSLSARLGANWRNFTLLVVPRTLNVGNLHWDYMDEVMSTFIAIYHTNMNPSLLPNTTIRLVNMAGNCDTQLGTKFFFDMVSIHNVVAAVGPCLGPLLVRLEFLSFLLLLTLVIYQTRLCTLTFQELLVPQKTKLWAFLGSLNTPNGPTLLCYHWTPLRFHKNSFFVRIKSGFNLSHKLR